MTKSIEKATKGSVLIKGNNNDKEPSYIKVDQLVLNKKTLKELLKDDEKDKERFNVRLLEKDTRITNLEKRVNTLEKDNKRLEADLKRLDKKLDTIIERWLEL